MAASDELHDLTHDAVVQIMGWCCICDRGFVAISSRSISPSSKTAGTRSNRRRPQNHRLLRQPFPLQSRSPFLSVPAPAPPPLFIPFFVAEQGASWVSSDFADFVAYICHFILVLQSAEGTKEVTQERMVLEQLHAYELKQSKKKLRFESDSKECVEKGKQRRAADGAKGAKFVKVKQTALQKKRLSSVAKEGGTPRRSPRVAGMNKNLGKRTAEAGAKDPQRKRLHVSEGMFILVDAKTVVHPRVYPSVPFDHGDESVGAESGGEADVVPKRKKSSNSNATEDDVEGDDSRFNKTVHLSLPTICKFVVSLKDAHYNRVLDAGFGVVFELTVKKNVLCILMCYLMGVIDPATMIMDIGNGRVLQINHDAVHHIFDLPMGRHTTPMPAASGHDDSLTALKDELGFDRSKSIGVKDLLEKLKVLVEEDDHVTIDLPVKVFFLILCQNLMCFGPAVCLGRVAAMAKNMDYAAMAKMDFCQLVVDELQAAVVRWQNCAEGCAIVPLIMYLHCLKLRNFLVMHTLTPRASYPTTKT
uniref:Uncharacterized protein n=1 Tax=Triticum aestivum TaxID=4565 RepID=A0A077RQU0_WHEAT|nr:unnamed protein product [Triticum aestivum]